MAGVTCDNGECPAGTFVVPGTICDDDSGFTEVTKKRKRCKKSVQNPIKTTDPGPIAPRRMYSRLAFPRGTATADKLKWLTLISALVTAHSAQGQPPLDMVRGNSLSSPYIYVARRQKSYINKLREGTFGGIAFELCDEHSRRRKFPEYLVTRFPKDADPGVARALPGVFKARRVYRSGKPVNRIIIVWDGEQPPPSSHHFLGKYLPESEVRPWRSNPVFCYNCMDCGHVARYCKQDTRCGVCADRHHTKECPSKITQTDGASATPSVKMKCFRCGTEGVPAWHRDCSILPRLGPLPPAPVRPPTPSPPVMPPPSPVRDAPPPPPVRVPPSPPLERAPASPTSVKDAPPLSTAEMTPVGDSTGSATELMEASIIDEMRRTISFLTSEVNMLKERLESNAQKSELDTTIEKGDVRLATAADKSEKSSEPLKRSEVDGFDIFKRYISQKSLRNMLDRSNDAERKAIEDSIAHIKAHKLFLISEADRLSEPGKQSTRGK